MWGLTKVDKETHPGNELLITCAVLAEYLYVLYDLPSKKRPRAGRLSSGPGGRITSITLYRGMIVSVSRKPKELELAVEKSEMSQTEVSHP